MAGPSYIGRFSPTPSGPLHFGSLIAALASYLDAKVHNGQWLVRIEDIDQPRSVPGADKIILEQLQQHHLIWDGEVTYQSQRTSHYQAALTALEQQQLTYRCICSRKQIKQRGPYYTGTCRDANHNSDDSSIRFRNNAPLFSFQDRLQGHVNIDPEFASEDFVLFRRDGLFTYQLAVVIDDIEQGITDIVRGEDLLTATSWQLNLWRCFTDRTPRFKHVPLVKDAAGRKLSKQNHAPALSSNKVTEQLCNACKFLGLGTINESAPDMVLVAAQDAWRAKIFPESAGQDTIPPFK